MKSLLQKTWYRYGFLLITAAWMFTLSFIFSNYWSFTSSPSSVQQNLQKFIRNNEEDAAAVWQDTAFKTSVLKQKMQDATIRHLSLQSNLYFLYVDSNLKFWSTHVLRPKTEMLSLADGKYFIQDYLGYFELIKFSSTTNNQQVTLLTMLPILWDYKMENEQFPKYFEAKQGVEKNFDLVTNATNLPVINGEGKTLFYLKQKTGVTNYSYDGFALFLRLLAIIFVMLFLHSFALSIKEKYRLIWAALFLIFVVVGFRACNYLLGFPIQFRQFELFDPRIYATSNLLPSLGDLLLNLIGVYWIVTFIKSNLLNADLNVSRIPKWLCILIGLASLALLVISTFLAEQIIRSLINDSKISFNVLDFSTLDFFSAAGLLALCLITLTYFHLSKLLLSFLHIFWTHNIYLKLFIVSILSLIYLSVKVSFSNVGVELTTLLWLLIYIVVCHFREKDFTIGLIQSKFLLGWTVYFSVSVTFLLVQQNQLKELDYRKSLAEKLALKTDPSSESLLSISLNSFRSSHLADHFERFKNESSNRYLKDSLVNENFSGYLNKYQTRIYTFDASEKPLFNAEPTTFNTINSIYNIQSLPSSVDSLRYYENSLERFVYLYRKVITNDQGKLSGYIFVEATPKLYKSESLYPALFSRTYDYSLDRSADYPHAIYSNGKLIDHYGDYQFTLTLEPADVIKKNVDTYAIDEGSKLIYNGDNGRVVIIIYKERKLLAGITIFAYLFCAFLVIILIFYLTNQLVHSRFNWPSFKESLQLNIRSQVHVTIISITLFSFVVIGFATISFFKYRYNKNNTERISRSIQIMAKEFENQFNKMSMLDDMVNLYDDGAKSTLQKTINDISEIHGLEVNVYDPNGDLRVSSQPFFYLQHLLSNKMEPLAYFHLKDKKEIQFIGEEKIGQLPYTSIYVPIRKEDGTPYAYINIPNFYKQSELTQEISNFLVTLINLNAFIFVLAGAIALLITNRITSSFTLITNRMKEINLGVDNEEIEWKKNDEIGGLVKEYNIMVNKLELSAAALAKTEREDAWREMAKQVAHEIKNPLTPMKLSIQYLQKAVDNNSPNVKELSKQVANTLVEQIDHLSKIAADFSQFANIGVVKQEVFDLHEVLQSLVSLYGGNNNVQIAWIKDSSRQMTVSADKTQLNRLFTNLLQNAVEASTDTPVQIYIREQVNDNELTISIKDYGAGIPEDMRDKIFTPNFTTKSSGTGLGLAICKAIVEKAGGDIYFETVMLEGTTFHVTLPLLPLPALQEA